jgi:hypothetical protein
MSADDFGDFQSGSADGFGSFEAADGFGEFEAVEADKNSPPQPVKATSPPPAAPVVEEDFGDFTAVDSPPIVQAEQKSPLQKIPVDAVVVEKPANDEFGDFNNVDSTPVVQAEQKSPLSKSPAEFMGENPIIEAHKKSPVPNSPTRAEIVTPEDEFGDFAAVGSQNVVNVPSPSTPMNTPNEDFGDFGAAPPVDDGFGAFENPPIEAAPVVSKKPVEEQLGGSESVAVVTKVEEAKVVSNEQDEFGDFQVTSDLSTTDIVSTSPVSPDSLDKTVTDSPIKVDPTSARQESKVTFEEKIDVRTSSSSPVSRSSLSSPQPLGLVSPVSTVSGVHDSNLGFNDFPPLEDSNHDDPFAGIPVHHDDSTKSAQEEANGSSTQTTEQEQVYSSPIESKQEYKVDSGDRYKDGRSPNSLHFEITENLAAVETVDHTRDISNPIDAPLVSPAEHVSQENEFSTFTSGNEDHALSGQLLDEAELKNEKVITTPAEEPEELGGFASPEDSLPRENTDEIVQSQNIDFVDSVPEKTLVDKDDDFGDFNTPMDVSLDQKVADITYSEKVAGQNADEQDEFSDFASPVQEIDGTQSKPETHDKPAEGGVDDDFGDFSAANDVQIGQPAKHAEFASFGAEDEGFGKFETAEAKDDGFGDFQSQSNDDWGDFNESAAEPVKTTTTISSSPSSPSPSPFVQILRDISSGETSRLSNLFQKNFPHSDLKPEEFEIPKLESDDVVDSVVIKATKDSSFTWSKSFLEQSMFKSMETSFPGVTNDLSPFLIEDFPVLKHRSSLVSIIEAEKLADLHAEDKFESSPERKRNSNLRANALDVESPGRWVSGRSMSTFSPAKADALDLLRTVLQGIATESPNSPRYDDTPEEIRVFMKHIPDLSFMLKPF